MVAVTGCRVDPRYTPQMVTVITRMTWHCFALQIPKKKTCTNFTVGWGAPDRTYNASCTYWASAEKKSPLNLLTQYKFVVFYHPSTCGREISSFTWYNHPKNTQKCFFFHLPEKKTNRPKKRTPSENGGKWSSYTTMDMMVDMKLPETFPKRSFLCLHSYSNPPLRWTSSNLPALLETR